MPGTAAIPDTAAARVEVAHTADLAPATLAAVRAILVAAFAEEFDGGFTDDDWDHALGGMHALAFAGDELVGHGSLVLRRFRHAGRTLRAGYVEAVAVRSDARRRGHAAAMMRELERLVRGGYDLGALSTSEAARALYRGRGWRPWLGTTWALTPDGVIRTADEDGSTLVLGGPARLDLTGDLVCDWREGDLW
jgi:aminoglycoside 2'-N-acetyltransferase I